MVKHNTINCVVCGKEFKPCLTCEKFKNHFIGWRLLTEKEDHFKIYMIVKDYLAGRADREESLAMLEKVDLSDMDTFKDSIKEVIAKIQDPNVKSPKEEAQEQLAAVQKKIRKKLIKKTEEETE